jgi:hypothetical protein
MTIDRLLPRRAALVVVAALGALALAAPVAHAGIRDNPENKSLPPTANPGYFLGYPTGTYSWHGCTATATKATLVERVAGAPQLAKGTHQAAVSFTVSRVAPYLTWQAKRGWKICGVQAAVVLSNASVDSDLLAEVGYTSGPQKGSTARGDGKETISVPIARKAIDRAEFEQYEGLTFSIRYVQDVTVYLKRVR